MFRSRIVLAFAVPFGFVAGHIAGYGFAHHDHAERAVAMAGHGYFGSLSTVAVPLLLLSLGCAVWNGRRGDRFDLTRKSMTIQLLVVFAGIEVVEHLAIGATAEHIVTEPALWIGLLAQVGVAFFLHWLLRSLYKVGSSLAEPVAFPTCRPALWVPTRVVDGFRPAFATTISGRGPPNHG